MVGDTCPLEDLPAMEISVNLKASLKMCVILGPSSGHAEGDVVRRECIWERFNCSHFL